jgi:hypothetical protein
MTVGPVRFAGQNGRMATIGCYAFEMDRREPPAPRTFNCVRCSRPVALVQARGTMWRGWRSCGRWLEVRTGRVAHLRADEVRIDAPRQFPSSSHR